MNSMKKIAAGLLACVITIPAVACSHGSSTTDSSSKAENSQDSAEIENSNITLDDEQMIKYELEFTPVQENNGEGEDPQSEQNFIVTTIRGEDGQIYVPQTDINGTTVTEAGGAPVTELYTGTTLATTYAEPSYTPVYKNNQAFWLDTTKHADFVFDGELLVYEFKIADDAVDGVYPLQYYFYDIANWDAQSIKDVTLNVGYVCVNTEAPANEQKSGSGLTINPGTVTAKPGDTVQVPVTIVNNPGFVGFRLRLRYDSKAMTLVQAGAGKDMSAVSNTASEMSARDIDNN